MLGYVSLRLEKELYNNALIYIEWNYGVLFIAGAGGDVECCCYYYDIPVKSQWITIILCNSPPSLFLVFAMFVILSPASRRALMTTAIVLFMFMG